MRYIHTLVFIAIACIDIFFANVCVAAEDTEYLPTRYGVAVLSGITYSPDEFGLVMLQGSVMIDYDKVAWHRAPDPLRLKLEVNLGTKLNDPQRGLASVNAMAFYTLDNYRRGSITPYVEAGIGVIYTDFQLKEQGLRLNFNPQAGVGLIFSRPDDTAIIAGVRAHHVSNAGLDDDNRGINSVLLTIGYQF